MVRLVLVLTAALAAAVPASASANALISETGAGTPSGRWTYTGTGTEVDRISAQEQSVGVDGLRRVNFVVQAGGALLDEDSNKCGPVGGATAGTSTGLSTVTCKETATNQISGVTMSLGGGADSATMTNNAAFVYAYAVAGGDGDDTIDMQLSDGPVTASGDAGQDSINGGTAADVLSGGSENDSITGNAGNDVLTGGAANDTMFGSAGNDRLRGDEGNDTLFGGVGLDRVLYDTSTAAVTVDPDDVSSDDVDGLGGLDSVQSNVESVTGSPQNDALTGFRTEAGGAGNDTLVGSGSDDFMSGTDGTDTYDGLAGSDRVTNTTNTAAQPVVVRLDGVANDQDGRGSLTENYVNIEQVFGGAGDDNFDGFPSAIGVELHGRAGADRLVGSQNGADLLFGEAGTDTILCTGTNDRYNSTVDPEGASGCTDGATYNANGTFTPLG